MSWLLSGGEQPRGGTDTVGVLDYYSDRLHRLF